MPFFHSYGFIVGLCSIMMNEMIVVLRRFEERFFLNTIVKYRIARLYLVPPLVLFLVKSPLVDEYDLSFVKDIFCGAAPLNKDTEVYLKKRYVYYSILGQIIISLSLIQIEGKIRTTSLWLDRSHIGRHLHAHGSYLQQHPH